MYIWIKLNIYLYEFCIFQNKYFIILRHQTTHTGDGKTHTGEQRIHTGENIFLCAYYRKKKR